MKNGVFGFFLGLIFGGSVIAQTSTVSSVSVVATDPIATEPGPVPMNFLDTGIFTINRQGPTNMPLQVFFTLSGTASNGVDYFEIEPRVMIPEGQRTARVQIAPRHDELVEGEERVILRLIHPMTVPPGSGYVIGPSNTATAVVLIRDRPEPTNSPPMVNIVQPPNGANFQAPADIHIVADTVDHDGWAPMVEFFANGAKIGESLINFIVPPADGTPISHEFDWNDVALGDYNLTARATDDQGATRMSVPVRVTVTDSNAPPRTVVSIVASDPQGSEIAEVPPNMERPQLIDPAIFTVSRTGDPGNELTVYYAIGGTASNGVDYVEIPKEVKIPAGARSTDIEIDVIDDQLVEGTETVTIQILQPACIEIFPPPPDCYIVGGTGEPKVLGFDDLSPGSEHFPVPSGYGGLNWHYFNVINGSARPESQGYRTGVVSPENVIFNPYGEPALIRSTTGTFDLNSAYLTAAVSVDSEMTVQVQGMAGGQILYDNTYAINGKAPSLIHFDYRGIDLARFVPTPAAQFVIDNLTVAVGAPSRAEARILDNDAAAPSNRPPVVSIVAPTNGAVFVAPADIRIIAQAFDSDGYVHTVEFFAGTNSLGTTTNNPFSANAMNPFQITWEDVPPGQYALTALATDNQGAQSRSRPVWISVIREPVEQTVVNIRAIDPEAAEQDPRLDSLSNNALLRVTRSGPTDFDLPVFYHIGGTASNGEDYVRLSGEVVVPKGSEGADIVIEAIDDKLAERTESVVLTLRPPVCPAIWPPPKECYVVGSAGRATAFILDDEPFETNLPPHVEITQPASGTSFSAPADIHIVAKTVDRDGYVGKVEFFANNHKIGEDSKQFLVPPPDGEPIEYEFNWNGVPPGQYALTARAIDENGASGFSAPVRISVVGTNEPPPTNVAVVTVYAIDGQASEGPITSSNVISRPYTNPAIFEIRRSGNAENSLRVFYEMHGMATEGVDYLDVPGIAEIPAGARSARVVIMPIDDDLPEKLESVIICLRPSPLMSILPDYVVGRPSQAAAVIADNDTQPVPYICLSDGVFHWCRPAANTECYRLECSSDLVHWTELCTLRGTDGAVHYSDPEGFAYDRRFYRAVPVPCPAE